jgi:hypothetical protein
MPLALESVGPGALLGVAALFIEGAEWTGMAFGRTWDPR